MIPRIIHFIWLGPMQDWVADNIRRFETLNPEHRISLHRDADQLMPDYREAYGHCINVSAQSDLIRLSVLERHGGWYFDTDTFALRPVTEIEQAYDIGDRLFVPAQSGTSRLSTPILAASGTCAIWPTIHDFIAKAELPRENFWYFANTMMTRIGREHPSLIKLGRPEDFNVRDRNNLFVYRRLMAGDVLPTNPYVIHGFIGYGTAQKPIVGDRLQGRS